MVDLLMDELWLMCRCAVVDVLMSVPVCCVWCIASCAGVPWLMCWCAMIDVSLCRGWCAVVDVSLCQCAVVDVSMCRDWCADVPWFMCRCAVVAAVNSSYDRQEDHWRVCDVQWWAECHQEGTDTQVGCSASVTPQARRAGTLGSYAQTRHRAVHDGLLLDLLHELIALMVLDDVSFTVFYRPQLG